MSGAGWEPAGRDPDAPPAAALALAGLGHFRLDRDSGATVWSREALRLFGRAEDDAGFSFAAALAAFPDEAQAALRTGVARTWASGETVALAAALTPPGGPAREVLARLRADPPDGEGRRRALTGVLIDVTGARAIDARVEAERALLRTVLDSMDQGLLVVAPDMSVPVLNRRLTELIRLPPEFVEARPSFPQILDYQYETGAISRETLNSGINAYILNREALPETHVYERATVDGRVLEVRTTRLPDGGFVRTFTDQTARRRREADVERAESEYRRLFENSVIGIYRATAEGRPVRVNPALARLNGYASEAEMLAAVAAEDGWAVDPAEAAEFMRRLARDGKVTDFVQQIVRHRTGERIWVSNTAWTVRDAAGAVVGFEGTVAEAGERKRAEDRIAHMARHDALTGLPNRTTFAERLAEALAAPGGAPALAVALVDLDRFKSVNDGLGHPAGDALLVALAERAAGLIGPGEAFARMGGDEFALMTPAAGQEAAAARAAELMAALGRPVAVAGREIVPGASIGVALAPQDGAEPTELLRCADVALYRAKAEGRGAVRFFAAAMDAELQARQRLELDLRLALERGELGLEFQPVIRPRDGAPAGYEALLRWTHPERGAIPPAIFIAIAEEARLIGRIGAWALARAAAEAARWPAHLSLWVNVSPVELAEQEFEAALEAALAAAGLAPGRLVLEVTETALIEERAELAPRLARLRATGVRTALDDFGTGWSSLGYLRRFPFDVIKLDRSFVADLDEPVTAAIVSSVLDLGRRLGLATVAEGVETEAQLAALRAGGCTYVQGRLVGPPIPPEAIPRAGGG